MAAKKKIKKPTQAKKLILPIEKIPSWHLPFILILTAIAYLPTFNADFVNWDDPDYVLNNPAIKSLSNFPDFFTGFIQGNYHPLTVISLALNYAISGYDAWSYHLLNLILHLINCLLVYRFALSLSRNNSLIAFTTSLLFGIHPMHVESVVWVAERKDVLYAMFFIGGHISFTKYIDTGAKKHYWMALILLVLSLLSKPAAVIFPVSLFCIDLLRARSFSFKLILEKVPFFLLAFIIGLITINAQKKVGAIDHEYFNLTSNILFGFYGIMMYLFKLIVPIGQSAFYSFPPLNEPLPTTYFIAPLFTLLLGFIVYFTWKRNKAVVFGISFYIINLLLVLQFFIVGSAIIAERYTYIPYIGIFYIVGYLLNMVRKSNANRAYQIIIPIALIFSVLTFLQTQNWKNGVTLWDYVIRTRPSSKAYNRRAELFKNEKQYSKAIEYYTKAIQMNIADHESFNNRANVYMDLNNFDSAYIDYKNSLAAKPDYYVACDNLGVLFIRKNMLDSGLYYLNKAIQINPGYKPAYNNRAICLINLQRFEESIKDWQVLLQYEPEDADIMNSIGLCYRMSGKNQEALSYINKAISKNAKGPFLLNRSYTYFNLKNIEMARNDALEARKNGVQLDPVYASSLGIQ